MHTISGIKNSYARGAFYDDDHAKVVKLLINGVHYVSKDGHCVPDIINI